MHDQLPLIRIALSLAYLLSVTDTAFGEKHLINSALTNHYALRYTSATANNTLVSYLHDAAGKPVTGFFYRASTGEWQPHSRQYSP